MPDYIVIKKLSGAVVHRYQSDAPVPWDGMEFEDFEHVAQPTGPATASDPVKAEEWFINVGPFFDRFGAWKLPILSSTDPLVQAVIKDSSVRKYIDLKGRRAELAQVIGLLQSKGFAVSAATVLDVQPTSAEVFNG